MAKGAVIASGLGGKALTVQFVDGGPKRGRDLGTGAIEALAGGNIIRLRALCCTPGNQNGRNQEANPFHTLDLGKGGQRFKRARQ